MQHPRGEDWEDWAPGKKSELAQIIGEDVEISVELPDGRSGSIRLGLAVMKFPAFFVGGGKGLTQAERREKWNASAAGQDPLYGQQQAKWEQGLKVAPWVGAVLGWTVLGPIAAFVGFRAGQAAKRGASFKEVSRVALKSFLQAESFGLSLLGLTLGAQELAKAEQVAENPQAGQRNHEQAARQVEQATGAQGSHASGEWFKQMGLDPTNPDDVQAIGELIEQWDTPSAGAATYADTPTQSGGFSFGGGSASASSASTAHRSGGFTF